MLPVRTPTSLEQHRSGMLRWLFLALTVALAALCFSLPAFAQTKYVITDGDRIFIDVYVVIKFGVSINAVAESLKESVKYRVEKFTGMIVDTVNVNIVGVKL